MRRALYAEVRASALPNRQSRRAARPAEASRPARPAPSTPLPRLRPFCTAPTMAVRTRSMWCLSTPPSDQGLPSVSTLPPSCSPRSGSEETAAPLFTFPQPLLIGYACMPVCGDFINTLEIITRTLCEVVNRERLCDTNAIYFGRFRNLWGCQTPCRSTDTIYLCLGCGILRWCGDAEAGRGRRPVL